MFKKKKIIGASILALVFLGMFTVTALSTSFVFALLTWFTAIALTAIIVYACGLLAS
jgi:hypothetical protein